MDIKNDYGILADEVFYLTLVDSRKKVNNFFRAINLIYAFNGYIHFKNESQTVLHKAVLCGYYEILSLILDLLIEDEFKFCLKLDSIRDHVKFFIYNSLSFKSFYLKNLLTKVLQNTVALRKRKRRNQTN
jgi:hypothetical protein